MFFTGFYLVNLSHMFKIKCIIQFKKYKHIFINKAIIAVVMKEISFQSNC
jgi:hypothetical protein